MSGRRLHDPRWMARGVALAGVAALVAAAPGGTALAQPTAAAGTSGTTSAASTNSANSHGSENRDGGLRLEVLSNRADLVSGGDALVEVAGFGRAGEVRVQVNGHDATAAFATRADGRLTGLVTGLRTGRNLVTAEDRHQAAVIVVTNHPIGGPVFAGPQVQPWDCTLHPESTGLGAPTDAQCDTAPVFRFVYMPASHSGFRPYDPANPPADVATTTTDQGVSVPYVVRVETGVEDRGIYQVAVLSDPAKAWAPWASQPGWNHKVVWPFGGGSAPQHVSGLPSNVLDDMSLSRGFMVANSGLNVHGQDANETVSAEAVTMLKEHVAETYGPIRYTIGAGCSGGSIQQYVLAEEYPGLLNGIMPNCSYPDLWTTSTEVGDCGLLVRYFATTPGWTDAQKAAVEGTKDTSVCNFWNATFVPVGVPTRAANCGFATGDARVYQPATNPGGVRCDVVDYNQAIWGQRRPQTPAELAAGHGFANSPGDNVGVEYGLNALRAGVITPAQFADLNARVGGTDQDGNPQSGRTTADPGTMRTAYRAGQVTEAIRLDDVPIIDLRGSANANDIHTDYHSWEMRARLDRANGGHANQVIWTWHSFGSFVGITPPPDIALQAFLTMDSWLAGIEADHSGRSAAAKVLAHKPAAAVDACWPANTLAAGGPQTVDPDYAGPCGAAFPHFGDARLAAGDVATGMALTCRLTALRRASLPALTDEQWAQLQAAFPRGVCDFTRPAPGFRPSLPWMSFAGGPGGQPLGAPPRSFRLW